MQMSIWPKLTDMRFQILEALDPQTTRDEALELLPKLETKWINNLQTLLPDGINVKLMDYNERR